MVDYSPRPEGQGKNELMVKHRVIGCRTSSGVGSSAAQRRCLDRGTSGVVVRGPMAGEP
jgi:hypothetical protein